MPLINALLEGYQVTVGSVDVSAVLSGPQWLNLNYPKISTDGLFGGSGTLSLIPAIGAGFAPDFFNPRSNPQQWQRGQAVTIWIEENGILERRFSGFVLRDPATPKDGRSPLELAIGDELVFRDIDSPAGDAAGVRLGFYTPRGNIIENIAEHIGWSGGVACSMPEFVIGYPCPKQQGSYVKQMGAIAASAGYGLYCDGAGILRAARFSLSPPPIVSRSFVDCFLEPVDGSDDPAAKVQAVISGRSLKPTPTENEFLVIEEGTAVYQGVVGIGGDIRYETYISRKTKVTERWSNNYKTRTVTTRVEVPDFDKKAFNPQDNEVFTLVLKDITTETERYSSAIDGKMLRKTTQVLTGVSFQPITINGQTRIFGELNGTKLTKESNEVWTYNGEVPTKHEVHTGPVRPDTLSQITTWEALDNERWRKVETSISRSPTVSGGVVENATSKTYIGNQYAPTEPSRQVPTNETKELNYQGCAEFGGITSEVSETPIYEFEYGVSDEQAERLAELHGAIRNGRHRSAYECAVEHDAVWSQWTPAAAARITLASGDIGLFLFDGLSINLSENAGTITFGCVNLGTVGQQPYQRPVGRVLNGSPPSPPPPAPTITPVIPPYVPVTRAEHGMTLSSDANTLLATQPRNELDYFGLALSWNEDSPFGAENDAVGGELGLV